MTVNTPQKATLIDTFSEGYRVINRRLWLVLVPIVLNLYLGFGAQISFQPLFERFSDFMQRMNSAQAAEDPNSSEFLAAMGQIDMRQPLAILNFIPVIALNQTTTTEANEGGEASSGASLGRIVVENEWAALLVFFLINLVALPLSAAFLTKMAEAVRGEALEFSSWFRRAVFAGLSILGIVAIILGVSLALGLPFMFFVALLMMLNQGLASFASALILLFVFWVTIYLGFANEAIVIGGMGPLRAIQASFTLVRRNFWGTLAFLGLWFVISAGCGVIWRALATSQLGLIAAIIGSAYIGSGLLAARMAFVQERLQRLQVGIKS